MIRHLRVSTLRIVDLGVPTMLAFFPSALILFASTGAWSVLAAPAGKEQDRSSAGVQIRSVLWAQQDAWNRGDIDGFMNGYARSKSTIFISEDTLRRAGKRCAIVTGKNIPIVRRWGRSLFPISRSRRCHLIRPWCSDGGDWSAQTIGRTGASP